VDASRDPSPNPPVERAAPRRTFIQLRELPGLLIGCALGRPVALRRVLGARRGGRVGAAICALLALLVVDDASAASIGLTSYVCFATLTAIRHGNRGYGGYRSLRLLLWTLPGPLCAALAAHALGFQSRLALPAAVIAAWLLLERGLRAGLGASPDQSAAEAGAGSGATTRTGVGSGSPGRE
jgi:hypothetical protein